MRRRPGRPHGSALRQELSGVRVVSARLSDTFFTFHILRILLILIQIDIYLEEKKRSCQVSDATEEDRTTASGQETRREILLTPSDSRN